MDHYLFIITILFFVIFSISLVYGLENINNNSIQQNSNITTTDKMLDYKFEPFLILEKKEFEDISHNNTLSLVNFTIAAWIKTNQTSLLEPAHLVNKGGFNTDKKGENMNYGVWFSADGTITGGFETESGDDFEVKSTTKYNDGNWHYVLLSYDGSILRLDIDGKKHISTNKNTYGAIPDTTGEQPLRIGANSLDKSKFFTGYVDEVRIWNRGLTDKEISQIYVNNDFESKGQIIYLDYGRKEVDAATIYRNTSSDSVDNSEAIAIEEKDLSQFPTQKLTDKVTREQTLTYNDMTNTIKAFNIAITADWGCEEDTEKTVENIQNKNPELVIANGDLSYDDSSECWFEIIQPLKSKMKIAMGDHEYSDTKGGTSGVMTQYLKPLSLEKTYYSFDMNNVHVTVIDPYIDYNPGSAQYQFIENDLKTASTNPNIDWTFVVESIPIYTSPAQHPANSTIRDTYHPIFDRYGVDLVFSSDNHNYQRTFPLKYNSQDRGDNSDNPIIVDRNQNNYHITNDNDNNKGVIYLITGTAGRSLYEIKEQAPFVAKQDDTHFGFLNIDINGKTLKGTFYANKSELPRYHYVNYQNNIIDEFTISKINESDNGFNIL